MKFMKKTIKISLVLLALLSVISCNKFFDTMDPTDRVSDKMLWSTTESAEYHVNYLYTYIYDVLMTQTAVGQTEALTDQLKYGSYNYNALCLIPSEIAYGDETTLTANYVSTYLGYWDTMYQAVAKVNNAIFCLHEYGQMSDTDKARLDAELRFIRAYLYFDLVKRYKEIIIYDEDMSKYAKDKALSSEEDAWNFIYEDLMAATALPAREASGGRLNKGMAWGFMTRAMLYAKRYDVVKTAAEEVKKLGYALEAKYQDGYMKSVAAGNNEAIIQYLFDRTQNVTHSFDFYYTPGGDYTIHGEAGGGYGTPTQEMVESYELAEIGGFPDWSTWHDMTDENPPYDKLEPRFHATILYNGAPWKGRKIESYVGGADGWCEWNAEPEPKGRSTTGYYLRKLVDETHDVIAHSGGVQPLIVLRYAEVLLNYAEACYHTEDESGANNAVKAIRSRVGLPYNNLGGTDLWEAIRQERKVELAYEGTWYWDLRRWGVAHKKYPEGLSDYKLHGLKITKTGEDPVTKEPKFSYEYVSVDDQDRKFPEKLYQFPLPTSELESNKAVNQFRGW